MPLSFKKIFSRKLLFSPKVMGNAASHHEPLDRVGSHAGSTFRRSSSVRHSKSSKSGRSPSKMDRLRRSFRDSFRRRKDLGNTAGSPGHHSNPKPHLWAMDEAEVRAGICSFHVKYLGCVEVFESRGMEVCEEALKTLRASRRRPVRAIFYISGDGLRVVEEETKGLIVDQTIEKVSFCAPDRSHEKGFSYICRDGLTRRWMCHGFVALKESGDRLSHAVGCAFQECLIRKNKREEDCSVTMNYDPKTSVFTRTGSFRTPSLTEQQSEPNIPLNAPPQPPPFLQLNKDIPTSVKPLQQNPTTPKVSTNAIERPHATLSMLQRQGSFRGFTQLNQASPFKRQLSLRISELPSNLERTRSMSLQPTANSRTSNKLLQMNTPVSPILEASPRSEKPMSTTDQVTAMCQQMSLELAFLTNSTANDDFSEKFKSNDSTSIENNSKQGPITGSEAFLASISKKSTLSTETQSNPSTPKPESRISPQQDEGFDSGSSLWNINNKAVTPPTPPATPPSSLPRPEQWLGKVAAVTLQSMDHQITPKRNPHLVTHSRAFSLDTAEDAYRTFNISANPFDPNYIAPKQNTNPFLSSPISNSQSKTVKTFEVQM
ncbi:protein numb isoform X2 [Acyrthosiphon pisum]|uniref:PID domain-containing protein n=1 Tax=Acyrthosiphon pisum TaxID=7029 RepID=A0A8R2A0E1_ACYPI|nr:protein numb isoform X2 [Acyrthosiphon pisum]|eukprot:XP_001944537.2 PREDICTED: protein numb isoform X2 [Acyrthosiphon pisum]